MPQDVTSKIVGKYAIRRELGRGGMGVVYLAEDVNLHREVAIKMVTPSADMSEEYLRRFRREAQAVASLSHPNIVHINAFEVVDGQFIIEMPPLLGGSLRDAIVKGLTIGGFIRILGDVLSALSACHGAGIVHRDVKPSNVLLTDTGRGMLTDFGVATLTDGNWQASISGTSSTFLFGGTPQYVSPGVWSGESPEPRHDLYSLGIVAYEVFLGRPPFRANSPFELMREISEPELPSLQEMVPQLSPEFVSLVENLVRRDGSTSAETVLNALKTTPEWVLADGHEQETIQFVAKREPLPPTSTALRASIHRSAYRWQIVSLLMAVIVAVLLFVLVWPDDSVRDQQSPFTPLVQHKSSQELTFHDGLVSAAELESLWTHPGSGAGRVLLVGASSSPGETRRALLLESEEGAYSITSFTDKAVWGVELAPEGAGLFGVTGTWAAYETAGATAFRWARVSGSATWTGEPGAPIWLTMNVHSQSDGARWTEHLFLVNPPEDISNTSFLAQLESTPFALPIIYNELPARRLSGPWDFSALLPAVQDARLLVPAISLGESVKLDGNLQELVWTHTTPEHIYIGRPKTLNATLQGAHDSRNLYLGVHSPVLPTHWRIRVAFLERPAMPMSSANWTRATLSSSKTLFESSTDGKLTPVAEGWRWEARESSEGLIVEIQIPLRHELLPASMSSRSVRLNISVFSTDDEGAETPVAAWGWPVVDDVAHGAIAYLEVQEQP